MLFTGHAEATLDAKLRLLIPAKYRRGSANAGAAAPVASGKDGPADGGDGASTAWYCFPWPGRILRLYPAETFELLAGAGSPTLFPSEDESDFETSFFGIVERLETDSAGRLLIPKYHVQQAQLGSEVVLVGARNRLEVRDRAAWMATGPERLARLPSQMAKVETRRIEGLRQPGFGG